MAPEQEHVDAPDRTVDAVHRIWADAFGVDRIGPEEHFLHDLGGHSLLAMSITAEVSDEFDVDLPLPVLLRHPTITGFAAAVDEAVRAEHGVETGRG